MLNAALSFAAGFWLENITAERSNEKPAAKKISGKRRDVNLAFF